MEPDFEGFRGRPAPPWARARGLEAVIDGWRRQPKVARQLVLDHLEPDAEARWVPLPGSLAAGLSLALRARGIERLYTHQAEAYARARSGEDLVVATPTASGKSLCYNLPILHTLLEHPQGRALYLFPTKALSRDQDNHLQDLMSGAGLRQGVVTYDGDTPADARRAARERGGVVVTNPDMLHAGILPHHATWARFFAELRFVVIDELHAYRGVLGSHLANVLRRLERVVRFHGSRVQYLFSSATIGNPKEHAERLCGRPVGLISECGAPRSRRRVLVYNPPLIRPELGLRRSYIRAAVERTVDLLRGGVRTLVFGQSRNAVEMMLKYLRDTIPEAEVPASALHAYRGGYLPETRRRIERQLREGSLCCVVATHALELGIDIGSLDAVVCAGYPGSMSALWQRFGRGGRRGRDSLALLVPSSHPLDQFFARTPELILNAPIESARIDPDNVEVLVQHLKCAAYELQFRSTGEEDGFPDTFGDLPREALVDALGFLERYGVVREVPHRQGGTTYHWSADAHPASHVSLRSPSYDNFVVIDIERGRDIAEMDFRSTHTMLHEQAIYQHEGLQYQVERLDYKNHKAFVRRVEPDYYTTAMTRVRVSVLEEEHAEYLGFDGAFRVGCGLGEVDISEKVIGYKKIRYHTHENVGYGEVHLPTIEKPSTAFWLTIPESLVEAVEVPRAVVMDALRGWLVALEGVAAVGLMMDPRDLGVALVDEAGLGPGTVTGEPSTGSPSSSELLQEGEGHHLSTGSPSSSELLQQGGGHHLSTGSPSSSELLQQGGGHHLSTGSPSSSELLQQGGAHHLSTGSPSSSELLQQGGGRHRSADLNLSSNGVGGRVFEPTLYIYDAVAGGVGLAGRLWEERRALVERSARLVARCECVEGCPACVGPTLGTSEAWPRRKVTLRLLALLGLRGFEASR